MVLLDVPEHENEWPQVAQVIEIDDDARTCTIHWFKGARTKCWTPCSIPLRGKKGKREPWIVSVPINYVLFVFQLTSAGHLPKVAKEFCQSYCRK